MRALYLDCFAGISGNMLLGGLLDLGLPPDLLRQQLATLPITGYSLDISRVQKRGIDACYVNVQVDQTHQPHRHLSDIVAIIDGSSLTETVRQDCRRVFQALAEAEAKVHGTTPAQVHFHEVGAVDTIIDVVGTVWGLHYLGIERVLASPVHVGSGFVSCQHGLMPVPAPATAQLLLSVPHYSGTIQKELATPTGAALLNVLVNEFVSLPAELHSEKIGYGAGTWDLPLPNVLRLYLGTLPDDAERDEVVVVETNIDDLNPEFYGHILDKLLATGALDAWLTPIMMKKGRPAVQLAVLTRAATLPSVTEVIFRETSSLGVRSYTAQRAVQPRRLVRVTVPWGEVQVKVATWGGKVTNLAPEYEDCRILAQKHGVPIKEVYQAALCAARALTLS